MNCPKCKSQDIRKDGIAKSKQRFYCKNCLYHFTVDKKSTAVPEQTKKNALYLYLVGLGFRSIARFLQVSHVAVYSWIKQFSEKIEPLKNANNIKIVGLDELQTYMGQKKLLLDSDCY